MSELAQFDRLWVSAGDCQARGDFAGALIAYCRAASIRPEDLRPLAMLCRLLYENPALFAQPAPDGKATPGGLVSVVTCSIDAARFERVRASYARAFGDREWEIVGIHDARSLAEGYARGFARARGETVVFAHDDIEILSQDLGGALDRALATLDVAGVVGTRRLTGPAFAWSGKANARGRIAEPAKGRDGVDLVIFNPAPAVTPALQALDGVFLACRRDAVEKVGFDAATFDGFHLYDIDFTYRAHRAGLAVGITPEVVLRHDSTGRFDERWNHYAGRFLAKFPGLLGERQPSDMLRIPFAGAAELVDYCRRLDEAGRRAARGD